MKSNICNSDNKYTMCILWDEHTIDIYLDITLLASSPRFYTYDIMSCDCSHISLYCPRNQIKENK